MQRHVFFTTVILFASMFGKFLFLNVACPNPPDIFFSIPGNVRPWSYARNNWRYIRHRTCIYFPRRVLLQTHCQKPAVVSPNQATCPYMRNFRHYCHGYFVGACPGKVVDDGGSCKNVCIDSIYDRLPEYQGPLEQS